MSRPIRWFSLLLIIATVGGGCASTGPQKPGTYTAVRHMTTGSNIPQPDSIDNANSTMSADQVQNEGNNQNQSSMRSAGGGGH